MAGQLDRHELLPLVPLASEARRTEARGGVWKGRESGRDSRLTSRTYGFVRWPGRKATIEITSILALVYRSGGKLRT